MWLVSTYQFDSELQQFFVSVTGLPDFSWYNIQKRENYIKWPQNTSNYHYLCIYWPLNVWNWHEKALQTVPKLGGLVWKYENLATLIRELTYVGPRHIPKYFKQDSVSGTHSTYFVRTCGQKWFIGAQFRTLSLPTYERNIFVGNKYEKNKVLIYSSCVCSSY
jgi:hypothetical protein